VFGASQVEAFCGWSLVRATVYNRDSSIVHNVWLRPCRRTQPNGLQEAISNHSKGETQMSIVFLLMVVPVVAIALSGLWINNNQSHV
jgi:hypothetical protein